MDPDTQKIIQDQIKQLPNDVRAAIISVDYQAKLQEITKRQRLLIDQGGKLEMETTLVMIGLEPLTDFTGNIQRELNVDIARAKEIALDVSENIFKPIRNSLYKMNQGEESAVEVSDSAASETEPPATKFTNTSEINLNRDQILREIENPETIEGGDRGITFPEMPPTSTTTLEVRPSQEVKTVPGEELKDISNETDIVKAKLTGPTVVSQKIVEAKPETKLPEVTKKRPSSGTDPYRESII